MGCCMSHYGFYGRYPQFIKDRSDFEILMFNEADIMAFYRIFQKVDMSGDGSVDIDELLVYLNVDMSKFAHRVFSMFDADRSGQVDFKEFVLCCWNYCTLGRATLILFAFDLYDADHSGEIDNNEIAKMLRDIYGKEFESNAYAKKLQERIRKELGKEITVAEFREFVRKYPALLFPAFQLQDGIAKRVMGNEFWKVFSERRMTLSGGKFIEIGEFMALHTNKGAMDDVLGAHDHHETHNGVRQVDVHKEKIKEVIKKTGTIQNRMSSKAPAKGGNGSMQGAGGDDAQLGYTYTKDSCTVSGSMETSQPVASRFAAPTGKKPVNVQAPKGPPPVSDKRKQSLMRIQSGKELDDHGKLSDYFQEMEANNRKTKGGKSSKNGRGSQMDEDDEDRMSDEDDEMTVDRSSKFLQAGAMSREKDDGERSSSIRAGSMMMKMISPAAAAAAAGASSTNGSSSSLKSTSVTPRRRKSVTTGRTEEEDERSVSTRSFKAGSMGMSMNIALAGGNDGINNSNASHKEKHYKLKGDRSPKRGGDGESSVDRHQLVGGMAVGLHNGDSPNHGAGAGATRQRRQSRGELSLTGGSTRGGSMNALSSPNVNGNSSNAANGNGRRQSRGELSLTGGSIRGGSMNIMGVNVSGSSVSYANESKKNRRGGPSEPTMADRVAAAQAAGTAGFSSTSSSNATQQQQPVSLTVGMIGENFYSSENYYSGPSKSRK